MSRILRAVSGAASLVVVAASLALAQDRPDPQGASGEPERVEALRLDLGIDETTGLVNLDVAAPISEVLRAMGQRFALNVMFEGGLDEPLELRVRGLEATAALKLVAAAAGLTVEEARGPIFLVRRGRDTDEVAVEESPAGGYAVPGRFGYDVFPLGDAPAEQSMKEFLKGFERTEGVSLAVAPDLAQRVQREYIQERRIYQRLLDKRGLNHLGVLRTTIDESDVRVYVSPEGGLYFCEVVFQARAGLHWHLVYVISAQGRRPILRLVLFTTALEGD
ncbi:MAG: hypothetical protein ACYTFT_08350 [Planctomycetota bacterium]|jgi:hypothetical protein